MPNSAGQIPQVPLTREEAIEVFLQQFGRKIINPTTGEETWVIDSFGDAIVFLDATDESITVPAYTTSIVVLPNKDSDGK